MANVQHAIVRDDAAGIQKLIPLVDNCISFFTLEHAFPYACGLNYIIDGNVIPLGTNENKTRFLMPAVDLASTIFKVEYKPFRSISTVYGKSGSVVDCVAKGIETPLFITAVEDLTGVQRGIHVVDNCIFLNTFYESYGTQYRLEYEFKDGDFKGKRCIFDVDSTNTKYLCPPLGWVGKTYHIAPKSVCLQSPVAADVVIKSPIALEPVRHQYVSVDSLRMYKEVKQYIMYEKFGDIKICFTVIAKNFAISFYHGHHQDWEKGTEVTLYNQDEVKFSAKCCVLDAKKNYVVVESVEPFVSVSPVAVSPRRLESYILFGYPYGNNEIQGLKGVIPGGKADDRRLLKGPSGNLLGFNGGPLFNHNGELLGINVENEFHIQPFDARKELSSTHPTSSIIIPLYDLIVDPKSALFRIDVRDSLKSQA
uniref:Uncharacterized protein n=1 Tax=Panagrolaimus sp. JU765 TaxID=591449 RepID=A0AC34PWC1_9BILA